MTSARTCRLLTLGCKVNQYETQYVKEMLEANGYREAVSGERADLCIVNTCTVTHEADAKGRQLIRRLAQANAGAALVVMGCYATRDPETVSRLPGVVKVITDKARLAEELRPFGVTRSPAGISRFDGHRRAFVKVQDGCLLNCSYCIIPHVRPVLRSRPIEEVAQEVQRLVLGGCREVVLTGIHLGHYGIDLSRGKPSSQWCRLWHLLRRLDALPGDFRIRLSSLEAAEVRGELVLGNHEDKFLRWEEGRRNSPTGESGVQLAPHHRATLAELRPEDWETMRRGTRYLEIPEHDVLVIHAGLRPGVALAEQDPDDLCRLQNIGPSGRRRRWGTPGTSFWAEHCDRPGWVVYGHTHSAQPLRYERTLGIDTGCCFGGMLTALELPVWRLHQVPAARNYFLETAARYYPGRFG